MHDKNGCTFPGIDIDADNATVGLVLPIWSGTVIRLDGDG